MRRLVFSGRHLSLQRLPASIWKMGDVRALGSNGRQAAVSITQDGQSVRLHLHHKLVARGNNVSHRLTQIAAHGVQIYTGVIIGPAPLFPWEASRIHPSPGKAGEARGHHDTIMPTVNTLLELGSKGQALRARADKGHPLCQDEKARLPAEMIRLDSRTICFLEFEPPTFCSSFRPSSTMNQLRKAAFKSDRKSSHWGRFPMGRFFASTSAHTQTQRFGKTTDLDESRNFKAKTSNTGLARS